MKMGRIERINPGHLAITGTMLFVWNKLFLVG